MRRIWIFVLLLAFASGAFAESLYELDSDGRVIFVAEPGEELELSEITRRALEGMDGVENILLLGIDARPGQKTGRSDAMILMTVNPEDRSIKLTSFMRDLYVEIPGRTNNRLNTAYYFGGPELLFETMEANFGIRVDKYVAVNFSMLSELVDAIGGLELTVDSEFERDRINAVITMDNRILGLADATNHIAEAGKQQLNGRQVQAYARWRYGSSDFARTQRQREVIIKILEKLENEFSLMEIMRLAVRNFDNIYTNLSVADILSVAPALFELDLDDVKQLRIPQNGEYEDARVSGMAVLLPDRDKAIAALEAFLSE